MYKLANLGFSPFFEKQLCDLTDDTAIPARIAAQHRGGYEVWSNSRQGFALLSGRLRHELAEEELPGVGDWVTLKASPHGASGSVIDHVLKRKTVFIRGGVGRGARAQVIAANVDLVCVVCGLDSDFNLRRIERYVARVWAGGAEPVVILNKADLCEDTQTHKNMVERNCPGVTVWVTSALHAQGIEHIKARIGEGLTAAVVGSSGAGKSTLVNALLGEERFATGGLRARDGRGCHTTSHRQLVLLPSGGLLLDTPGMRELQLSDENGLERTFDDLETLSLQCRFRDCHHQDEPGCAVQEAVASGAIAAERLDHFHKLEREARSFERRHDERLRRQTERVWGQLYDEAARLRRWRRGE